MFLRIACFLLWLVLFAAPLARAEESVRSTQEELRRRNLYFGDIDGRRSGEFEEAVKRYQKRKGFAASGKEDPETLRSLGLLARAPNEPPPKELPWPEEPILKSDAKMDVAKEATELASTTGVAPESVAPATRLAEVRNQPAEGARGGRAGAGISGAGRGGQGGVAAIASQAQHVLTPREATQFVVQFLRAVAKGDLKEELSLYADHVDYYGNGNLDRRLIEHSLRKYYAHWTRHDCRLSKVVGYAVSPRTAEVTVTYQVNFTLKNSKAQVKGATENRLVINAATSSPRIVAIRESRVRN